MWLVRSIFGGASPQASKKPVEMRVTEIDGVAGMLDDEYQFVPEQVEDNAFFDLRLGELCLVEFEKGGTEVKKVSKIPVNNEIVDGKLIRECVVREATEFVLRMERDPESGEEFAFSRLGLSTKHKPLRGDILKVTQEKKTDGSEEWEVTRFDHKEKTFVGAVVSEVYTPSTCVLTSFDGNEKIDFNNGGFQESRTVRKNTDRFTVVAVKRKQAAKWNPWRVVEVQKEGGSDRISENSSRLENMASTRDGLERLKTLLEDKNGISIERNLKFGRIYLNQPMEIVLDFKVTNRGGNTLLKEIEIDSRIYFSIEPNLKNFTFEPGDEIPFKLCACVPEFPLDPPTRKQFLLRFIFEGFEIGRIYEAEFLKEPPRDENVQENGAENEFDYQDIGVRIRGQRPMRRRRTYHAHRFEDYHVPSKLLKFFESDNSEFSMNGDCTEGGVSLLSIVPVLGCRLDMGNYASFFQTLIHLQEIGDAWDMRKYKQEKVKLRRGGTGGEFLLYDMDGLKDGRPSVLAGDVVIATEPGRPTGRQYEGVIHMIRDCRTLFLKFDSGFHDNYRNQEKDLKFEVTRGGYKRTHYAVELAGERLKAEVLFPTKTVVSFPYFDLVDHGTVQKEVCPSRTENPEYFRGEAKRHNGYLTDKEAFAHWRNGVPFEIKWFNGRLNERQKLAVRNILTGESRPLPYLIFGPPGTGKTVTVVEAVLQIFHVFDQSRILIVTPSNSSADLICLRLAQMAAKGWIPEGAMVRLMAFQRDITNVAEEIKPFIRQPDDENDEAVHEDVFRARILICTWHISGSLHLLEFKQDHFTHVVVDEAGHLTEPETLVPLTVSQGLTRIVLAGDPRQLAPVLMSKPARKYKLDLSLMERLMDTCLPYKEKSRFAEFGGYNPQVLTELVVNYRSHPEILSFYSRLFYSDHLVPSEGTDAMPEWVSRCSNGKLRKFFPYMIRGVLGGKMERSQQNPSCFNRIEAIIVTAMVKEILTKSEGELTESDVGVVTPYRGQAELIKKMVQENIGFKGVKVGSVEEYQGQEKRVIVISTVRTSREGSGVLNDKCFFSSPRHINVSISRAKEYLIIVGDPKLMAQNQHWSHILEKAKETGRYLDC